MNERVFSLPKVLRYLEWTILVVILLVALLMSVLVNYFNFPEYPDSLLPFFMVFVSLAGCGILSFVFPLNRPLWQIRLYIFLEMLLIIPTTMMGVQIEII